MIKAVIVYLFDKNWNILLGKGKRWPNKGRRNWYGWKFDEGEDEYQCALRELKEESWIVLQKKDLQIIWILNHIFDEDGKNWLTYIFMWRYDWEAQETDEMTPKWFTQEEIPFDNMRDDDKYWYSDMLENRYFEYEIHYDKDEKVVKMIDIKNNLTKNIK